MSAPDGRWRIGGATYSPTMIDSVGQPSVRDADPLPTPQVTGPRTVGSNT
ncbi:hypothetical protein EBESD8_44260 [Rhodococcus aetherivorans]|nr:hypothetical protein EBESD8_44260 [Rhodococcus aetherivorans]